MIALEQERQWVENYPDLVSIAKLKRHPNYSIIHLLNGTALRTVSTDTEAVFLRGL